MFSPLHRSPIALTAIKILLLHKSHFQIKLGTFNESICLKKLDKEQWSKKRRSEKATDIIALLERLKTKYFVVAIIIELRQSK